MGQTRDTWYARQLRRERARQDLWEESLKVVVKEGENLEQELRKRRRNRPSTSPVYCNSSARITKTTASCPESTPSGLRNTGFRLEK
jgi:hypothetical protein